MMERVRQGKYRKTEKKMKKIKSAIDAKKNNKIHQDLVRLKKSVAKSKSKIKCNYADYSYTNEKVNEIREYYMSKIAKLDEKIEVLKKQRNEFLTELFYTSNLELFTTKFNKFLCKQINLNINRNKFGYVKNI